MIVTICIFLTLDLYFFDLKITHKTVKQHIKNTNYSFLQEYNHQKTVFTSFFLTKCCAYRYFCIILRPILM